MKNKEGILIYLDKDKRAYTNQFIKIIFNGDILINIGSYILINTEKYDLNTIFEKLQGLNVSQAIFTSEKFIKLIEHCILNDICIKNLKIFDDIKEETAVYTKELITELKRPDISLKLKLLYLRELKDIEYAGDSCIEKIILNSSTNNEIVFTKNNKVSFDEVDLAFVRELISALNK